MIWLIYYQMIFYAQTFIVVESFLYLYIPKAFDYFWGPYLKTIMRNAN